MAMAIMETRIDGHRRVTNGSSTTSYLIAEDGETEPAVLAARTEFMAPITIDSA